jgi:amino acid permease
MANPEARDRSGTFDRATFDATALMIGSGVGAGIMAVPYLVDRVGLAAAAVTLSVAWCGSLLLHLMLAEVALRTRARLQVLELMKRYALRSAAAAWPVFVLIAIAITANLAAYLHASAAIVAEWTGWSALVAQVVAYAVTAVVVLVGLRAVRAAERYAAAALLLLIAVIVAGGVTQPLALRTEGGGGFGAVLALYAMAMYAFWTFYGIPQVIASLPGRPLAAVRAIRWGLAGNGAATLAVAAIAVALPGEVTEVAIVGIAQALAPWVGVIGSALVLLALQSSAWSVSLALADVIRERTRLPASAAWLLATLPPLLAVTWGGIGFVDALRVAAGATGVVLALVTVAMLRAARREGDAVPGWTLGRWGDAWGLGLATLLLIAMAIGALMPLG